jgi:hypothetical protein
VDHEHEDEIWYVLGFDSDDVVGAWQDQRLAMACSRAWRAAGLTEPGVILQTSGEGEYLVNWYIPGDFSRLLDRFRIPWRQFVIGAIIHPPENAEMIPLDVEERRGLAV